MAIPQRKPKYQIGNILPQLEEEFPDIPTPFIQKLMNEVPGIENIKEILSNEISQINSISSVNWVLDYFKAFPCEKGVDCKDSLCVYFHYIGERRRVHKYQDYSVNLCSSIGNCGNYENCKFSHNENEVLYHPDLYRKNPCPYLKIPEGCPNEFLCPFVHNFSFEEEVLKGFKQALDDNDRIETEKDLVAEQILEKMENIKKLTDRINCVCNKEIRCVWVPCGHTSCLNCSENDSCVVCKTEGECFQITYNKQ
jgi:hypothetical protein